MRELGKVSEKQGDKLDTKFEDFVERAELTYFILLWEFNEYYRFWVLEVNRVICVFFY